LLFRNGQHRQKLAYVYFEEEPQRQAAAKLLTKEEARRIAVNVAKRSGRVPRLNLSYRKVPPNISVI
jgi:hypothetical protein